VEKKLSVVAKISRKTFVVSGGKNGDGFRLFGGIAAAVADMAAGGDVFDQGNA